MVTLVDDYIGDDVGIRRAQIIEAVLSHCAHILWPTRPEKVEMAAIWAQNLKNAIRKRQERVKSVLAAARGRMRSKTRTAQGSDVSSDDVTASGHEDVAVAPHPPKKRSSGLAVASVDTLCRDPVKSRTDRLSTTSASTPTPTPTTSIATPNNGPESVPAETERTGSSGAPPNSGGHGRAPGNGHGGSDNAHPPQAATPAPLQPSPFDSASPAPADHGPSPTLSDDPGHDPLYVYREGMAALNSEGDVVYVSMAGSPLTDMCTPLPGSPFLPIRVKRLSGGITNELFHVYDEDDPANSVVVRVYGKETERVISRESELFYQSLFIDTYVRGRNFLVYRYLHGYETLPYTDMAGESHKIARALADFQVRATAAARRDSGPPMIAEGENGSFVGFPLVDRAGAPLPAGGPPTRFDRESNYTRHSLTAWVDQISSQEIIDKVTPEKRADFAAATARLRDESACMLAILRKHQGSLGEGVGHNDLLSANIMRNETGGDLKIIDFDYTKRDYLLFDAANHFNEYTGLECDYARYFPAREAMAEFLTEYRSGIREELAAAHAAVDDCSGPFATGGEIFPQEWELFWGDGVATCPRGEHALAVNADKEALVVQRWTDLTGFLTLCSHLSWSIWALVQEAVSQLDVDFLDYANLRLNRYLETKDEYTKGLTASGDGDGGGGGGH